jgi:hypothetical protein
MIILTINGFSSSQLKDDLQADAPDFKYSIHAISDPWAQKCLILTAESVDPFIRHNPINNLVALEYVLSSQKSSITSLERRDDPTAQLLYNICAEKVKEEMPQEIAQILDFINICNEMSDSFKDILAIDEPSQAGLTQIREHAQKGLDLIKNKIQEYRDLQAKLTTRFNMLMTAESTFIKDFKTKNPGRMNWKACYQAGKHQGMFASYSSPESLKSVYNRNMLNVKLTPTKRKRKTRNHV